MARVKRAMSRREAERLWRRMKELHAKLYPKLPGIDVDDLALILQSVLRPPDTDRCLFAPKVPDRRRV